MYPAVPMLFCISTLLPPTTISEILNKLKVLFLFQKCFIIHNLKVANRVMCYAVFISTLGEKLSSSF